jgi:hypothetical protein
MAVNSVPRPELKTKGGAAARPARARHHVYVIELDERVLKEHKFVRANPQHQLGMACLYVGMTGLDPDLRFDRHKAGIQSNRYVFAYGVRLLPKFYEPFNPMPYRVAAEMERDLAEELRSRGYAVWQA